MSRLLKNTDSPSLPDTPTALRDNVLQSAHPCVSAVPGVLEYESLQGLSGLKPTGFRKRSSSVDDTDAYTMASVLQQLSYFHSTMHQNGLDAELVRQAVKQLFYLIGAVTLNSLFLRKDMCSCRKGMQIR